MVDEKKQEEEILNQKEVNPIEEEKSKIEETTQNEIAELDMTELLKEFEEKDPKVVRMLELRDNTDYKAEEIIAKLTIIMKKKGYENVKLTEKKLDEDGNIIAIGYKGEFVAVYNNKENNMYADIAFNRNASYLDARDLKRGSQETAVDIANFFDDGFPDDGDSIKWEDIK